MGKLVLKSGAEWLKLAEGSGLMPPMASNSPDSCRHTFNSELSEVVLRCKDSEARHTFECS